MHADRLFWAGDGPQLGPGAGRPTSPSTQRQVAPPRPVHDPSVAAFHLRAWVRGAAVEVDGTPLVLGPEGTYLVQARHDGARLTVRVGSVVLATRDGAARPVLSGAEVLHASVASHLSDETEHVLSGGEERTWAWGGAGAVEGSVAVSGRARVELGAADVVLDARG